MRSKFRIKKGLSQLADLELIPGIQGAWGNPHGEGADIIEIEHQRDEDQLAAVIKDQTIGTVILELVK